MIWNILTLFAAVLMLSILAVFLYWLGLVISLFI